MPRIQVTLCKVQGKEDDGFFGSLSHQERRVIFRGDLSEIVRFHRPLDPSI
jgi:hypothetical protein